MRILKIITINIFFLALVFIVCDYLLYKKACKDYYEHFPEEVTKLSAPPKYKSYYLNKYTSSTIQYFKKQKDADKIFRPVIKDDITKPTKPPLLIFGFSFAFGGGLENNQTFSYKLQKLTNRISYNYAVSAYGIQHMLYIIKNKSFFDKVEGKPEYAIYVYINDHQRRLYGDPWIIENNGLYVQYRLNGDKLELRDEILPSFLYKTFIVRKILEIQNKLYYNKFSEEELLNNSYLRYPGIKFVILKYSDQQYFSPEHPNLWKALEREGFIIIDTKDLIGREFTQEDTIADKFHPNESAWDLVVPKLVEKLGL